jgi:competence protein ComEC
VRLGRIMAEQAALQAGRLALWMPVWFSCGIGLYFALRFEPGVSLYALAACIVLGGGLHGFLRPASAAPSLALALAATGFLDAGWSAHRIAAPVLGFRYHGPVSGTVSVVDLSASGLVRITLRDAALSRVDPAKTPRQVRISLSSVPRVPPAPGQRLMLTATLSPPAGPVEPGGFDFSRHAWFLGLGAIGYARAPPLEFAPPDRGLVARVAVIRHRAAEAIRIRLPGDTGAVAAAILTGDRSAVQPNIVDSLRASNLAHLLAISGLHMGLLTGFVFAVLRYALASAPSLALRFPIKKWAAGGAFLAASAYLVLSGTNVATQRAWVMVAVMLLAVILDRRAVTLRAVAVAAMIVLALRPVSLVEPGFQMSFAATTALVATFGILRDRRWFILPTTPARRVAGWAVALVLSSLVAGLATAPVAAFHFNRLAVYGLWANLASVPVMGLVVMPAALTAILAETVSAGGPFWMIAGTGLDWILNVAATVAAWEGAVLHVRRPETMVLALIASGGVFLAILRGGLRMAGLIPLIVGFTVWSGADRPDLLISADGRLVGLMTERGRWLSKDKAAGFVAASWLENDGDGADQAAAALRLGQGKAVLGGLPVLVDSRPSAQLGCPPRSIVITAAVPVPSGPCIAIGRAELERNGSHALSIRKDGIHVTSAREVIGARLWSNWSQ